MARTGTKKAAAPKTTAQQLGTIIKSARDIMRKDKGLNGDLDRLPMLTWIMFLKFLDDMERIREEESVLSGQKYRPAIQPPYRWRDWAAQEDGVTGDELIAFINQDEAALPNGKRGPGLFKYLRGLQGVNGGDRRDVIATVFKGAINRMINGYLLRDVINKVNGIHFSSSEEIHTLSHLYESMLKEMRDAAGDSGEFYTPRALVRFMVEIIDPKLGETVLDPACGTGGFLVETFMHMEKQCKTVKDRRVLQESSIKGGEAKPLPYMLAQMNLLLHGLENPHISSGNSLGVRLAEVGESDRVDAILTNPPFGGEEEPGIQGNFPADLQTSETALLFVQLIVRRLKKTGRCAMVVHDGFLSNTGVASRVKRQLLSDCNLHTIVRLPFGVFEPYTPIRTNLLFFQKGSQTKSVWYYDVPITDGRKKFTKTKPLQVSDLLDCKMWWSNRAEGPQSWEVNFAEIEARDFNLDFRNPTASSEDEALDPAEVLKRMRLGADSLNQALSALEGMFA